MGWVGEQAGVSGPWQEEKRDRHISLEKAAKGPIQAKAPLWDFNSTQASVNGKFQSSESSLEKELSETTS